MPTSTEEALKAKILAGEATEDEKEVWRAEVAGRNAVAAAKACQSDVFIHR